VSVLTSLGQSVITVVVFLAMLAILVIVHELGHFLVARLAGVRVLEFGVGFPPRARVLRSEGETLYTLNWLPIGGFVKLEGEDGDSSDPRSFAAAALPVKLIILVAGVAMNLVLAFAIMTGIALLPSPALAFTVNEVQADSPAQASGLVAGDEILAVNGTYYDQYGPTVLDVLRSSAGQTVTLTVRRAGGQVAELPVVLRDPSQLDATHGALGISARGRLADVSATHDPPTALRLGAERTGAAFLLILRGLGDLGDAMINRPTEAPPVQGPVGIAVGVGDVFWQQGPVATLFLAGLLSANLALVNILPLPPLDGGRMLVLLIKAVVGKRLSLQAERLTYVIGFGFLMAFLAWITFFDIARQVGGGQ
jgi:regulator of sigma E protease